MLGKPNFSRSIYCQTSISVQFEIGNARMFSPLCERALYKFHNSGRWFFGSHWPNSSRKLMMRSLARAFSSSRRAPPMQQSKPNSSMASSNVTDWCLLRDSSSDLSTTVPRFIESSTERTIKRSPSSAARWSRNSITSL